MSAPRRMITWPVAVSPVKPTKATLGCSTSALPVVPPGPVTTLNTPGGSPTSSPIRPSASADNGARLGGFRTTVLPVARAGATL